MNAALLIPLVFLAEFAGLNKLGVILDSDLNDLGLCEALVPERLPLLPPWLFYRCIFSMVA